MCQPNTQQKQQDELNPAEWARTAFRAKQKEAADATARIARELISTSELEASTQFKERWPGILEKAKADVATKGFACVRGDRFDFDNNIATWPDKREMVSKYLTQGFFFFKVQEALRQNGFKIDNECSLHENGYVYNLSHRGSSFVEMRIS